MLNRSKAEAEQYILDNSRAFHENGKTDKEIGAVLNVSGPRVCQMRGALRPATVIAPVETALAPEAA